MASGPSEEVSISLATAHRTTIIISFIHLSRCSQNFVELLLSRMHSQDDLHMVTLQIMHIGNSRVKMHQSGSREYRKIETVGSRNCLPQFPPLVHMDIIHGSTQGPVLDHHDIILIPATEGAFH
ncbi:uncharacterized protein LOC111869250 [Cryptotermes secundus]|uniref:uncharacterized protein LOC111869250 n=1 Tax=Cryptotermes secundus TaxID=105785 RepID=UPI001454D322|nr:uncharacterized protein LOC111869250 [Cryptotermes secundus]